MKNTNIQWTHSTVNPVMGCAGCELWKPAAALLALLVTMLVLLTRKPESLVRKVVSRIVGDRETSTLYRDRERLAADLTDSLQLTPAQQEQVIDTIRSECKCYAGLLGTLRAGHAGYAGTFEVPKLFPGRMSAAAAWGYPTPAELANKPWLAGLPRLIFISDMGDALSGSVPFEYLHREVIVNVGSPAGRRHIWLWLTKRPERMADFADWLQYGGGAWPANLVPMTTVTARRFASRVDHLRRIPATLRGLSLEPLLEPVDLDLRGIDWLIVGGGSDVLAAPFHVEWALQLAEQCRASETAFFLKQLGRTPMFQERPLELPDRHGGDWNAWPAAWRLRQLPAAFRTQHLSPTV